MPTAVQSVASFKSLQQRSGYHQLAALHGPVYGAEYLAVDPEAPCLAGDEVHSEHLPRGDRHKLRGVVVVNLKPVSLRGVGVADHNRHVLPQSDVHHRPVVLGDAMVHTVVEAQLTGDDQESSCRLHTPGGERLGRRARGHHIEVREHDRNDSEVSSDYDTSKDDEESPARHEFHASSGAEQR